MLSSCFKLFIEKQMTTRFGPNPSVLSAWKGGGVAIKLSKSAISIHQVIPCQGVRGDKYLSAQWAVWLVEVQTPKVIVYTIEEGTLQTAALPLSSRAAVNCIIN